ncbi:hypothetical protein GOP47_0006772 [Adiantum capillus-veneris]|uniref:Pentatricopeptide repeat-containing protein n=1 Tax=Adiantum capillus-veneris TaxID=13818 RepID=A0A9D4V493_ADICA|nr:hypothetical protein GOP47_0006772 [Adiantum capillus-veneris]
MLLLDYEWAFPVAEYEKERPRSLFVTIGMILCMPLRRLEKEDAFGSSERCNLLFQRESKGQCVAFEPYAAFQRQEKLQFQESFELKEAWPCLQINTQLPSLENFAQTLQVPGNKKNFKYASHVHLYMCYLGLETKGRLRDLVVSIFVECGRISDAQQILSRFPEESSCFWPTLLERYIGGGEVKQALILFLQSQCDCAQLSKNALQALVKCCTELKCVEQGLEVHGNLVIGGRDSELVLATRLVEMYAKCGLLAEAKGVLDEMPARDVFAWNVLSLGYAEHGLSGEAFQCLELLKMDGLSPNAVTFVWALKVCGKTDHLEQGQELHTEIALKGYDSHSLVGSALSDMYAKCCQLVEAEVVFEGLKNKDVISWTALISEYADHGLGAVALVCFERMKSEGVLANAVTYVAVLKACTSLGALSQGQQVHVDIIEEGFEKDVLIGNTLIDMYAKCGWLIEAQGVFEELPVKDVISWTALLAGYGEQGLHDEVLDIMERMLSDGVRLDPIAFVYSIKACARCQALQTGSRIHCEILKEELEANTYLSSALMDMYAKFGLHEEADEVFNDLLLRDVSLWTTRMTCLLEFGLCKEALACLEEMQIEGVSPNGVTYVCSLQACIGLDELDVGRKLHVRIVSGGFDQIAIVSNALVDFYAKCGSLEETWQVFDHFPIKDMVSWNTLLQGFNEHEVGEETLNMLENMQVEGFSPNKITFLVCLRTCRICGDKDKGKRLHAEIIKMGYDGDMLLGNMLMDMYTKLCSTVEAYDVFKKMVCRDVVSWNILIAFYAEHQLGEQGLQCLEQMVVDGVLPNSSTLSCGLNCCASLVAPEAGQELHSKIIREGHLIDPVVGHALVDMYASCGLFTDGRKMFDKLLVRNVGYNAIISGYAHHGHDEEVLSCYEDMLGEGVPPDSITFACVFKACGNVGAIIRGQEAYMLAVKEGHKDDALVGTMVIDMYSKSGCLMDACHVFEELSERDVFVWSALIAGFARHGECEATFSFLEKMESSGVLPDEVALLSVLTACSHSGLVEKGQAFFQAVEEQYRICITEEHYNCMIDLFSRAGHLEMTIFMISQMPGRPSKRNWETMLSASRNWGNSELARYVFEKLDWTQGASLYVMQHIYTI